VIGLDGIRVEVVRDHRDNCIIVCFSIEKTSIRLECHRFTCYSNHHRHPR